MIKAVMCGTVLMMGFSLPTFAKDEVKGCEAKELAVEQQIEYAKAQGNEYRIKGLERALAGIQNECSEETLRQELQVEVEEKAQEVQEREQELAEAKRSGKADKIEKKRQKLEESQQELLDAKRELEWNYGQ
ncbi:uncharacterized protein DUF1090 [Vibrio sp. ES.051]|uniref:DUF1090 domain-containing protein n=1 Tax=Vibrio sp. ES.051 TaxID=1761909 RepID=UPI000BF2AA09|nr:DUF1090 domain-containing protein [Vibrio sp. ES.051]PFG45550.1 uncharacterized protein DUF1090 [Vibrio sp. ES.051]